MRKSYYGRKNHSRRIDAAKRIYRRHIDRGALAVRHNDGLKEIGASIKAKCKQLIDYLKQIGVGGAIVRILVLALAVVGGIFVAKKTPEVIKNSEKLMKLVGQLDQATKKQRDFIAEKGAKGKAAVMGLGIVQKLMKTLAERAAQKAAKAEAAQGKVPSGYFGSESQANYAE